MTDLDDILGPPALEETRRYRRLAEAQLSCARWEMTRREPQAVASMEAALNAVIRATNALPADGSLGREVHEEELMRLVRLRDTIHSLLAEAQYYVGQAPEAGRRRDEQHLPQQGEPVAGRGTLGRLGRLGRGHVRGFGPSGAGGDTR